MRRMRLRMRIRVERISQTARPMNGVTYSNGAANSFAHEIAVADTDIDRLGHANNVAILQWVQDAAEAHSAKVGYPLGVYERMGAAFIVRRHELDYLRPALLGQRLLVRTWVSGAKGVSCVRETEIATLPAGLEVARATTTWVFAELGTARIARIPSAIRVAFGFEAGRARARA